MITKDTAVPKTVIIRNKTKIAVIGSGAIGGLVAGYLKVKGEDVSLVGQRASVEAIKENGLQISGARGKFKVKIDIADKLNYEPNLIILATKTQGIDSALKDSPQFIKSATLLTAQNGVRGDDIAVKYIPKENIISSIVMFGATYLEPAKIVHNFEGSWILGRPFAKNDEKVIEVSLLLNKIFPAIGKHVIIPDADYF